MCAEHLSISVEYVICTTSDWTAFRIIEGGWWSDLSVAILEGYDKLNQEILYSDKTIVISKNPRDESKVVVTLKCMLNIVKEYLSSNITYLITKGDIESTVIRTIIEGKEQIPLVNATKIPNDPKNPLSFEVPVRQYMQALEEKRKREKVEKVGEMEKKPDKKIEEEKPHIIIITFDEIFKETFEKKEPTEKDVEEVFEWLRSHSENATKFLEADIYRDLTLGAETRFRKFRSLEKKKVENEVKETLEKIRKRYDDLRKIQGKFAIQTPYIGGVEKEEQKVAPKE